MMRYFLLVVLLLCFVVGCGSGHVQLRGKVVFSDDGSPLTTGTVTLSSPTFQSRGEIGENGQFVMESLRPGDGLPPGTYTVTIVAVTSDDRGMYSLIDTKWSSTVNSGKTIDVDKMTRFIEIEVDRNPLPIPGRR